MEKNSVKNIFLNGLIKENPVFVLILGICPTLAVSKTLESALGMGLALMFVLIFSNLSISLIKKIVPSEIRIPVYIVVIATFVTITEMLMKAYFASLAQQLGIFLSLIVVNCIVLGRAEGFASKNNPFLSLVDAISVGLGFLIAISIIASIREILGYGTLTFIGGKVLNFMPVYDFFGVEPTEFFGSNPGAFIVLAIFLGSLQSIFIYKKKIKIRKGA
jgi:electron transport complex protein RnfE